MTRWGALRIFLVAAVLAVAVPVFAQAPRDVDDLSADDIEVEKGATSLTLTMPDVTFTRGSAPTYHWCYGYRRRSGGEWSGWKHLITDATYPIGAGCVGREQSGKTREFTGLTTGATYEFEVVPRACSEFGQCRTGGSAAVTVTLGSAPSTPTSLTALRGNRTVVLTWGAPDDDGGLNISYEYRYRTKAAQAAWSDWMDGATSPVTVGDLVNGTVYEFEVRATNQAGPGEAATAEARPATTPGVPTVSAAASNNTVRLTWTAPDDGGEAVTAYEYRYAAATGTLPLQWQPLAAAPTTTDVTSLTNGLLYNFEVRARNAVGVGGAGAVSATPGTVPSAPRDVVADPGSGRVTLGWRAPADDGGGTLMRYEYRHARTGQPMPDWTDNGLARTATVDGLANGVEYTFEVRAVNAFGESPAAQATARPAGPPGAPVNLAAEAGAAAVTLSWQAPATNGAPVTGYEYRTTAEGLPPGPWTDAGQDLSVTVADLVIGLAYEFDVRALSDAGAGPSASVTATPGSAPSAPANLVAEHGNASATLRWDAPADGGGAVVRYEYRYAQTGTPMPGWTDNGLLLTVAIEDLSNGTEYTFEVRAVNAFGNGPPARATARPGRAPAAPRSLRAEPGDGEVTLSWEAPRTYGAPVTGYEYRATARRESAGGWTRAGTALSVTVSGLVNGTSYRFEVRALSDAGTGPPASTTATPGTPSGAPAAPVLNNPVVGDRRVELSWRMGDPGDRYEYRYAAVGENLPDQWTDNGQALTVVVTGLANGQRYDFEVRAVNAVGAGPAARVTATPNRDRNLPAAPLRLAATAGDRTVALNWTAPAPGRSAIRRYELRYAAADAGLGSWSSIGTATTTDVTGLVNGVAYRFEVRAVNDAGAGSAASTTATPATTPDAPASLVAQAGDGAVALSWQALAEAPAEGPTDGGAPVLRYEYRHGPAGADWGSWRSVGSATRADVPGLANDTPYGFEVRAVNRLGAGASAAIAATPRTAIPSAPRAFTARPGDRRVMLSWTAPERDGGVALEYYEYRWKAAGGFRDPVRVASTDHAVTIAGLTNGTLHVFQVRAVNSVAAGPWVTAEATPGAVPGPPQALSGTAADGEVVLAWREPANSGGRALLRYEYRWRVGEAAFRAWHSAGLATRATVHGLENGTAHVFEVRAVNGIGAGSPARAAATPATVPGTPVGFAAARGDGRASLSWQPPANDGGSPLSRYEYRYGSDAEQLGAWTGAGKRLAATVGQLDNGVEYHFELRAVNAIGAGVAVAAMATPGAQPSAPRNLVAEPGDGTVTLRWEPPVDDGGWELVRYEWRHKPAEGDYGDWTDNGIEVEAAVTDLTNHAQYTFEVRAVNAIGAGDAVAVDAAPWVASVPEAPAVTATADDGLVALSWTVPDNGGAAIEHYEYRWRQDGDSFGEWIVAGLATELDVGDLNNGTAHVFEVRAVNAQGAGPSGTATATPAGLPGTPALTARAGDGLVELSWDAPDDDGGAAIERYDYRWSRDGDAPGGWADGGLEQSVAIRNLDNGTAYAFEVRAVNGRGPGPVARASATPTPGAPADALATAWLSRFGRAQAGQVVDAVDARLGWTRDRAGRQAADDRRRERRRPQSGRVEHQGAAFGAHAVPLAEPGAGTTAWRETPGGSPLAGLDGVFHMQQVPARRGGHWSVWGQLATARVRGEDAVAILDGRITTGTLGADYAGGPVVLGIAASYSLADGDFRLEGDGYPARAADAVETTLGGVYPYLRFAGERIAVWGVFGRATGSMTMTGDGRSVDMDLGSTVGALGIRGELPRVVGIDLTWKTDVLGNRTTSESQAGGADLAEIDVSPSRMRLLLEASRAAVDQAGGTLAINAEVGARYDGGEDAGGGIEMGGAIRYAGARRLTLEARLRGLVADSRTGYREFGAAASLLLAPRPSGQGLSLRLTPAWGIGQSRTEQLWDGSWHAGGFDPVDAIGRRGSTMQAEVAYGLAPLYDQTRIVPFAAMDHGAGERRYRLGWRLGGASAWPVEAQFVWRRTSREPQLAQGFVIRISHRP